MVNSGHQISFGAVDYYTTYRSMIEAELTRPALAAIEAYAWRIGNHLRVAGRLTNLSGQTLTNAMHNVTLNALVYEDAHVIDTDHILRAAPATWLYASLAPNAAVTFTLDTPDLSGVNWDKLHTIVLADYRPMGPTGPYDALQAAVASPAMFSVMPNPMVFMLSPGDSPNPSIQVRLQGPPHLSWSLSETAPWLAFTPTTGTMETPPVATISNVQTGWQAEPVTLTASDGAGLYFTETVTVSAYLGPIHRLYVPVTAR
jgi:hypothetical protein